MTDGGRLRGPLGDAIPAARQAPRHTAPLPPHREPWLDRRMRRTAALLLLALAAPTKAAQTGRHSGYPAGLARRGRIGAACVIPLRSRLA